eukprot:COSAG01_NODE_35839_length_525_cov_54.631455_1_plen_48_part_10
MFFISTHLCPRRPAASQRRDAIGDAPVEYTRMEQAALSQGHHDMDDEE